MLAEILNQNMKKKSDRLIIEKLNELGFKDNVIKQELFELFYNDEELN